MNVHNSPGVVQTHRQEKRVSLSIELRMLAQWKREQTTAAADEHASAADLLESSCPQVARTAPPDREQPPPTELADGYNPDYCKPADELECDGPPPRDRPTRPAVSSRAVTFRVFVGPDPDERVLVAVSGTATDRFIRRSGTANDDALTAVHRRLLILNLLAERLIADIQRDFFLADEVFSEDNRRRYFPNPLDAALATLNPVEKADQDDKLYIPLQKHVETHLGVEQMINIEASYKSKFTRLGVATPFGVLPLGVFWPAQIDLLRFWYDWAERRAAGETHKPADVVWGAWRDLWPDGQRRPKWISQLVADPTRKEFNRRVKSMNTANKHRRAGRPPSG
jgi:hypothetical protein